MKAKCHICGKPATCIGAYEGHKEEQFSCDDCCGHGNEDGHCRIIPMSLDRNEPGNNGKGKYALVNLRQIDGHPKTTEELADCIRENPNCLDFGMRHSDSEFFVIRLKDKYAAAALEAYAQAIFDDGSMSERLNPYAHQVLAMAERARKHPARKIPD